MKIIVEIDDKDVEYMVKEYWYKTGKRQVARQVERYLSDMTPKLMGEWLGEEDFRKLTEEALDRILKEYSVRDMIKLRREHEVVKKFKEKQKKKK